jgi:twitching motility protein PilJ
VLEKSQEINQLMRSISQATVSQANTSQTVTDLMQQIAQLSEASSTSSKQVAQSILETAQVAQKLESTVAKFRVAEETETRSS